LIDHDMNRCVLCGRCVRACNELRGVKVLQYNKNETETYVGTLHDKLLKDVNCRFCQACVEVCPTGTIRDKMFGGCAGCSSTTGTPKPAAKREDQIVPCRAACPAGIDIPRYIRLAKEGNTRNLPGW
jgi:predicted molibdopterin-dependent oxidoreductase YjgC